MKKIWNTIDEWTTVLSIVIFVVLILCVFGFILGVVQVGRFLWSLRWVALVAAIIAMGLALVWAIREYDLSAMIMGV